MTTTIIPPEKLIELTKGITELHIDLIARAESRTEIDQIVNDYFGFIRTLTRALEFDKNINSTDFQRVLARHLKESLQTRRKSEEATSNIGFAAAFKFAYEKLTFDEVRDIVY